MRDKNQPTKIYSVYGGLKQNTVLKYVQILKTEWKKYRKNLVILK